MFSAGFCRRNRVLETDAKLHVCKLFSRDAKLQFLIKGGWGGGGGIDFSATECI